MTEKEIHTFQSSPDYKFDPYKELAMAIIYKAAEDYETAYKRWLTGNPINNKTVKSKNNWRETIKTLYECEIFFLSDWFNTLASDRIHGPTFLKRLQEKVEKDVDPAQLRAKKWLKEHEGGYQ